MDIDFDQTIRAHPVAPMLPDETPIRPPNFWLKKPRRVPSPRSSSFSGSNESADCTSLNEMKSIIEKFHRNRSNSFEPQRHQPHSKSEDQSSPNETFPSDPCPSVVPKEDFDTTTSSEDSFNLLSGDEDEDEMEVLDGIFGRAERLGPIKKKRQRIEIVGGGLVPKKTSLARGPRFDSIREVEFSQQPPKAYAYLEESLSLDLEHWLPGEEVSMEQYEEIRDELKRERYKKFFISTPYYPMYDDPMVLTDTINFNTYYPPVTVDSLPFVIKLRAPMSHPPPPPSIPSHLVNVDTIDIRPPPPYPFHLQSQLSLSTFAAPGNM